MDPVQAYIDFKGSLSGADKDLPEGELIILFHRLVLNASSCSQPAAPAVAFNTNDMIPELSAAKKCRVTPEEFEAYVDVPGNILTTCKCEGIETVYFVSEGQQNIHVSIYDKGTGIRYTSDKPCLTVVKQASEEKPRDFRALAVNYHTFLVFETDYPPSLLSLEPDWSSCSTIFLYNLEDTLFDLVKTINGLPFRNSQTSIQKDGLSRVRSSVEGDFSLKSRDGAVIKVHKAVLAPLWPFFKGLLDSDMKEASENEVELDVCESTMDCMVRYLYGQSLDLTPMEAARLLVGAQLYDLPELLNIAERIVLRSCQDLQELIMTWQLAYEAKNDKVRYYCAKELHIHMGKCGGDFAKEFADLSKEELQYLLNDLAWSMTNAAPERPEVEKDLPGLIYK